VRAARCPRRGTRQGGGSDAAGRWVGRSAGEGATAFTPDGKTLFVASTNKIVPISTATNTPGQPIGVGGAIAIAITPDGKTAYVANGEGRPIDMIVPISTATNTASPRGWAGWAAACRVGLFPRQHCCGSSCPKIKLR
jgi:DNA-binding beta-propeller fold protein YncE